MTIKSWDFEHAYAWGVFEQGPKLIDGDCAEAIRCEAKVVWAVPVEEAIIEMNRAAWRGFSLATIERVTRESDRKTFDDLLTKFEYKCAQQVPGLFGDLAQKLGRIAREDPMFQVGAPDLKAGDKDLWSQMQLINTIVSVYQKATGRAPAAGPNGPTWRFKNALCDRLIQLCNDYEIPERCRDLWIKGRNTDPRTWVTHRSS